jgi:hypothetical protein
MTEEEKPPSRVLRQRFEREYALPLAEALFQLEPRCQSVLVTIGQYWCDEATDAVHSAEIACDERDPTWPLAGQARRGAIGDPELLAEYLEESARSESDGPAGLADVQHALHEQACQKAFGKQYFGVLDENSDMIVAFASHCREVSDQEQPSWRSHTPYGLIRRPLPGEPPTFEVIGPMYRPQWEDRWDVLENDGVISGWDDGPPEPPAIGPLSAKLAAQSIAARPAGKPVRLLGPVYRVLLFLILIASIVAVRGCLAR